MALIEAGVTDVPTLDINADAGPYMRNTMIMDKNYNHETALLDIYRIMRPGEPPALETALDFFNGLFFKPDNYDLSAVGRVKINSRLDMKADASERILSKEDIVGVVKELVDLRDDAVTHRTHIDHWAMVDVRSVGDRVHRANYAPTVYHDTHERVCSRIRSLASAFISRREFIFTRPTADKS